MKRPDRVGSYPTLLLIDDCVLQRDLYEVALQPDFHIITATRGGDGLRVAVLERPDAIVLDVMMPGLTGWETCARLKCEPATADIPVLLLTGANELDLSDHAAAVGASALLKKPCSAEILKTAILDAIKESASRPVPHPVRSADEETRRVIPIR
jgi:putative two-component system response regulator